MKKTLGGQRLGSGNKMTVDLHGFERSTHDLSYIWRSTMSAGTLVPFMKELALPGDTFDIHLNCDIKTHPTIGPLFGSFKAQLDVFVIPIRLYHSALHNNRLGIGMNMAQIRLPKFNLIANKANIDAVDLDNSQVNPSCIMSYLGIRGVGILDPLLYPVPDQIRKFNAVPFLAYWDIFKNYYANKQEENAWVVSSVDTWVVNQTVTTITIGGTTLSAVPGSSSQLDIGSNETIVINFTGAQPNPATIFVYFWGYEDPISLADLSSIEYTLDINKLVGTYNFAKYGGRLGRYWGYITDSQQLNAPPELKSFPLGNIDLMRDEILSTGIVSEFNLNPVNLPPYSYVLDWVDYDGNQYPMCMNNQEGLAVKTYQSDLFNNWLSTEWIDGTGGINEITRIDTSSGYFNIDTLVLSRKVYDMLNRIAVSGGSYNDWLEAVYDHEAWNRAESPVYMGGLIKELVFQEVVSNSQSTLGQEGSQPLGTLAGKGVMSSKHKGGTVVVKVDEPSYIMGIVSLTPRLDYSQGNKWDVTLDTMDDLHKPSLDEIGFQELMIEQMAWWSTYKAVGAGENDWTKRSAGKQPAWINYMTNVNEVRGNFAVRDNEMFMVLNRRYEGIVDTDPDYIDIADLTTYIDPRKFNHIFAQTSLDAQNFWTQISVDITARRKMSAKVMPNL